MLGQFQPYYIVYITILCISKHELPQLEFKLEFERLRN